MWQRGQGSPSASKSARPPDTLLFRHLPPRQWDAATGRQGVAMRKSLWLFLALAFAGFAVAPTQAADEPDLIFKRSTVFKLLTPNDKLATYGVDDPEVEGVACHFTVPEKGGFTGWLGLAEQVSDISLACRQIGPMHFKSRMEQG